jgi:ParB-like chromosome segregation protein Spo0J
VATASSLFSLAVGIPLSRRDATGISFYPAGCMLTRASRHICNIYNLLITAGDSVGNSEYCEKSVNRYLLSCSSTACGARALVRPDRPSGNSLRKEGENRGYQVSRTYPPPIVRPQIDQSIGSSPTVRQSHVLSVSSLRQGYSPRRNVDEEHIHRLAQSEEPLPPILVHRESLRIIDGVHRVQAAIRRGRDEIEAVFFDGSEEEAFIRAVEENISHGLPLTLADRKTAATRIISTHPHLSDRAIARHSGLAAKTVAALRQRSSEDSPRLNTRVGADGRRRPLNGTAGRHRAAEAIAQRPDAPLREIARIANVSLGTAHDVRLRLRRGEDPIPARPPRAAGDEGSPGPLPVRRARDRAEPAATPEAAAALEPADLSEPAELSSRADDVDLFPMLRKLAKDPALRHTDQGRELLRLLHTSCTAATDWSSLIEAVPPYRAESIALIARQCAESWDRLARGLEHRAMLFVDHSSI